MAIIAAFLAVVLVAWPLCSSSDSAGTCLHDSRTGRPCRSESLLFQSSSKTWRYPDVDPFMQPMDGDDDVPSVLQTARDLHVRPNSGLESAKTAEVENATTSASAVAEDPVAAALANAVNTAGNAKDLIEVLPPLHGAVVDEPVGKKIAERRVGNETSNATTSEELEREIIEHAIEFEDSNGTDSNGTIQEIISARVSEARTNVSVTIDAENDLIRELNGKETLADQNLKKALDDNLEGNISAAIKNDSIRKAIKERVEEAIDDEVAEKRIFEHRLPTEEELNETIENEIQSIWDELFDAQRHKIVDVQGHGVFNFFSSVQALDWCILSLCVLVFLLVYRCVFEWPVTKTFHGGALLIFVAMAGAYNAVVLGRLGQSGGSAWLIGYLLEVIFSVENIFVFHAIVKAFRMPRWISQKLLFIVVLSQIAFQMVFYMGLAAWLRSLDFLTYLIGVWLLYLGYQAALEDDHEAIDIMETRPVGILRWLLGDRLSVSHDSTGSLLVTKNGKTCLAPAGLMLMCLLVADLVLEVDVTLTKLNSLDNEYLCFSSSLVASFCLPELFFVARDLFSTFFALKYGISFVLVFCGLQALLHTFVTLTALASLCIIVIAILLSVAVSVALRMGSGEIGTEDFGPSPWEDNRQDPEPVT